MMDWLRKKLGYKHAPCPSEEAQNAVHQAEDAAEAGKMLEEEGQILRAALRAHLEANHFDSMLARTFRSRG